MWACYVDYSILQAIAFAVTMLESIVKTVRVDKYFLQKAHTRFIVNKCEKYQTHVILTDY